MRAGPRTRRIHLGICGEHGGDPASVVFCHELGLDYVSCSPFRVETARLAAGQAAVGSSESPRRSGPRWSNRSISSTVSGGLRGETRLRGHHERLTRPAARRGMVLARHANPRLGDARSNARSLSCETSPTSPGSSRRWLVRKGSQRRGGLRFLSSRGSDRGRAAADRRVPLGSARLAGRARGTTRRDRAATRRSSTASASRATRRPGRSRCGGGRRTTGSRTGSASIASSVGRSIRDGLGQGREVDQPRQRRLRSHPERPPQRYIKHGIYGYACRAKRNSNEWSTHAFGIAIDVSSADEYMGKCTSTVNKYHASIWQNHGWYWGLAFCDPMHFQYATNCRVPRGGIDEAETSDRRRNCRRDGPRRA